MPRVSQNELSGEIHKRIWKALLKSLSGVKRSEDLEKLLEDLLTPTEKIMLAKRLMIAILIQRQKRSRDICRALKVSKATVNTIRRDIIRSGVGYRIVFKMFAAEPKRSSGSNNILETIERLFDIMNLPIKGSPSSMRRWQGR